MEPGYYWVKYKGEWFVAKFEKSPFIDSNNRRINEWSLPANKGHYMNGHFLLSSYDFDEINGVRILNPDETIRLQN